MEMLWGKKTLFLESERWKVQDKYQEKESKRERERLEMYIYIYMCVCVCMYVYKWKICDVKEILYCHECPWFTKK